jgi:hypothetical protein
MPLRMKHPRHFPDGITKFWMIDLLPTHQMQRWKMDMLGYDFHVIHQPEMMLCECNLLSRYNSYMPTSFERMRNKRFAFGTNGLKGSYQQE